MARGFFEGWGRPPVWAVVALVLGALLLAVGIPYAATRTFEDPADPADLARMDAALAEAESSRAAAAEAIVRVLVVGDSYTDGSGEGGRGIYSWARIMETSVPNLAVTVSAAGGSGYINPGQTGRTFADLAASPSGGYDLVVFFGSRNDRPGAADISDAALSAFNSALAESPDASLLVIGPPWVDGQPPDYIQTASQEVEDAAAAVGAAFVDPLDEGWFVGRPELIGADGVHPTDAGHQYMAELISPVVAATVAG